MGSRYGGLKQIDPVGPAGETLLDYAVFDALRSGFGRVVFVIRRDFEAAFKERVAASFGPHIAVDYVYQELSDLPAGHALPAERSKPWGTAHAVRTAREAIREPFVVINADDFYGYDSYRRLADFLGAAAAPGAAARFAMAGFRLDQTLSENGTVARGICRISPEGLLQSLEEHTKIAAGQAGIESLLPDGSVVTLPPEVVVSMNIWGFTPQLFNLIEERFATWLSANSDNLKAEWYLSSLVDELINAGDATVQVLPTAGRWFGVTYREDRAATEMAISSLIAAGDYPTALWCA